MGAKFLVRAFLLAVILGCAAERANAGIIVFGTDELHRADASNPLYDSSGYMRGVNTSGDGFILGGFNLVHPEWGLSLTHVAQGWAGLQGGFEADARDPNRVLHAVDYWIPSPTSDLALVHFAQPILNRPIAELYFGEVPIGTHFNWAGYGRLAYPGMGEVTINGIKRGGENIIDQRGTAGLYEDYVIYNFNPLTGGASLPLEMGVTGADSGNGLFSVFDARPQLFALNAIEFGGFSSSGALLLGPDEDFIREHVPSSVPEPPSWLIFATLMPLMAFARQFRMPSSRT